MAHDRRSFEPTASRRRFRRLLRFVDHFLPAAFLADPGEALLRARVTALAGLLYGTGIFAAVQFATERPSVGIRLASYALSIGFLLIPFGMRLGLEPLRAQRGLMVLLWSYATILAVSTGGRDPAGVFVAFSIPFFGILFSGVCAGLFWSFAMSTSLIVLWVALGRGFEPPIRPDPDAVAAWSLWAGVIGIFMTLGLATSYEWLRADVERKLRREKRRADRLHAAQHEIDRRFQAELTELVEKRTQELETSHRELRRAERLASVGTLAAGVAHEINNPVGAILISAQFALAQAGSEDRESVWRAALEESQAQALRCARIVKALLRFSSGSTATLTPQNLNEVVKRSLAAMRSGLDRPESLRIDTALCDCDLEILGDPVGIEQIVVNLVRNALDASVGVEGRVRVATEPSAEGPRLRVADEGTGIGERDLPRIFDPFFSTREREGGTGLGLSIVHGIVQEHGASIEVASEPGRGTCFSVCFPIPGRSMASPAANLPRHAP